MQPGFRLRHQAAEKGGVHPIHVLESVDDREPRFGSEEDPRVSIGHVEVDQQRARGTQFVQHRGDVDGDGGCANPALGADDGEDIAALGRRTLSRDPLQRVVQLLARHRFGDAFVHAGPHRFQHERAVEPRQHHQDAGQRVEPFDGHDLRQNRAVIALIDDDRVGLPGRRLRQRPEPVDAERCGMHTATADEVDEVLVAAGKNTDIHGRNSDYRTSWMTFINADAAPTSAPPSRF